MVLSAAQRLNETVDVPLLDAHGYVLSQDVLSTINVPPADNSAMDGYALRASDKEQTLPISQRIPAGSCWLTFGGGLRRSNFYRSSDSCRCGCGGDAGKLY